MNKLPICPKCGAPVPEDAPAGLCPNCLVRAGFESEDQAKPQIASTAPSPASSRFESLSVEELAGRFPQLEILELLGIGGMGAVYKARQMELDRMVAVKILPPEVSADPAFAERFTREARALARLSHPNIVAVHDFGRTGDGLFYFVMEYVDGVNLRQAIQSGHMDPKQALAIVPQICDALQFAHDEGIVHRDIKPENILIDKRGRVKIADFGLAKLLGQEAADHRLTATQQVMGTLRDMAPEQMEGTKSVDHRADIYSLGVVFYELLTGELPVGRFAPPSKKVEIDVRLDEVVLRALEMEPEKRYQHASELKTDVENVSRASTAHSIGTLSRSPKTRFRDLPNDLKRQVRNKLLLTAAGYLTCLLAGVAAIVEFWTEPYSQEIKLTFQPKSKAFNLLVLEGEFRGKERMIGPAHPDAPTMTLHVAVTGNEGSQSTLSVKLPGPWAQRDSSTETSLDRKQWLKWLADHNIDTRNPAALTEAEEFISFLKRYDTMAPTSSPEFAAACQNSLTDYSRCGMSGGFSGPNFGRQKAAPIALCLTLTAIFLIIALRIRIGALRAVRNTCMPDAPDSASDQFNRVGRISLWMAIGGMVVPVLLALGGVLLAEVLHPPEGYFMLCVALLFVLPERGQPHFIAERGCSRAGFL